MTSIGKKDFLRCIVGYDGPDCQLIVGNIYVCESIATEDIICNFHASGDCFGIRTENPKLPHGRYWCGRRFEPCGPKRGFFDYLLTDIDEPVFEDV